MGKLLLIIFSVLLVHCNSSKEKPAVVSPNSIGQLPDTSVINKFKNADSVLLLLYNGEPTKLANGLILQPKIIKNGKLNSNIIKKRKLLLPPDIIELTGIISTSIIEDSVVMMACFDPVHSIIIYSSNKISYLDICFSCYNFETSKDLEEIGYFDPPKWEKLYLFFKKHGIGY